jgi:hypothetical protein
VDEMGASAMSAILLMTVLASVAALMSLLANDPNLLLSLSSKSDGTASVTQFAPSEAPNFLFPHGSVRPSSAWQREMSIQSTLVLCTFSILSKLRFLVWILPKSLKLCLVAMME